MGCHLRRTHQALEEERERKRRLLRSSSSAALVQKLFEPQGTTAIKRGDAYWSRVRLPARASPRGWLVLVMFTVSPINRWNTQAPLMKTKFPLGAQTFSTPGTGTPSSSRKAGGQNEESNTCAASASCRAHQAQDCPPIFRLSRDV